MSNNSKTKFFQKTDFEFKLKNMKNEKTRLLFMQTRGKLYLTYYMRIIQCKLNFENFEEKIS